MKATKSTIYLNSLLAAIFMFLTPFFVNAQSMSHSEAGVGCLNGRCVAAAEQSSIMNFCEQMKARAAWAKDWQCRNATYFQDAPTQRQSIPELRRRYQSNPNSLSDEEKALVQAANRIGMVAFNGCKNPENNASVTGNAFLVRIDGRDAIVTSLHQVFGKRESGWQPKNNCSYEDLSRNVTYFPNASYIEGNDGAPGTMDTVEVLATPNERLQNWIQKGSFRGAKHPQEDWMVLFLSEQVSQQRAPDGQVRGYIKRDGVSSRGMDYEGYTLGFDPRFSRESGIYAASYQKCAMGDLNGQTWNACNMSAGASSSLLGVYSQGEIKLRALQNLGGFEATSSGGQEGSDIPTPISLVDRNAGLSVETIESESSLNFDR